MSGIAIHTASPINPNSASKPQGITPRTATADTSPTRASARPATTTAALGPSPYPAAQPGASVPAPTAAAHPPFPQLAPTPTTRSSRSSSIASNTYTPNSATPPLPQPGAVPTPRSAGARRPSIPPPPKVGEVVQDPSYYAPQYAAPTPVPHQTPAAPPMSVYQQNSTLDTPIRAQPPASMTSSVSGPRPGDHTFDLNHPPGYAQDAQASFQDRPLEPYNPFSAIGQSNTSNGILGGNIGSTSSSNDLRQEKEGMAGIWDTAVSWAKTAGVKLQETEEEIWRRVNGGSS